MRWRRLLLVGLAIAAGLTMAPAATADTVDGVLDVRPPVLLNGTLQSVLSDPTVLIQDPAPSQQQTPLILEAENVTVTHKVYEFRRAEAENPVRDVRVVSPNDEHSNETYRVENATIEITALGTDADVLLGPGQDGALRATLDATGDAAIVPEAEGVRVLDGYREKHGFSEDQGQTPFAYEYIVNRSLVALDEAPPMRLSGAAHGYVWDAHVLVRNQTETIATYDTGETRTSSTEGVSSQHRFEYVTIEARGAEATLQPTLGPVQVLQRGASVDVDGAVELRDPEGSLADATGLYETSALDRAWLSGNLSVTMTPAAGAAGAPSRVDVGLKGDLDATNAPYSSQEEDGLSPTVVAAGAGGATVLGVAAWYALSAKGASLAVVGTVKRREDETSPAVPVQEADRPGDLLFDPDRFSLYHLVRERPGLSPSECRDVTGIEEAGEQLEMLAGADLLGVLDEDPPRYFVPGTVPEEHVEEIAFLRQPRARRMGELLAVHGLTPETRLAERARRSHGALSADQVADLVHAFVEHGLAYREASEEGFVVDPTDKLFACLEAIGEGAVPEVS